MANPLRPILVIVCIAFLAAGCTSRSAPKQSRAFEADARKMDRLLADRTKVAVSWVVGRPKVERDAWTVSDVTPGDLPSVDLTIGGEDVVGTAMASEERLVALRNAARYGRGVPETVAGHEPVERVRLTLMGSESLLQITNLDMGEVYLEHRLKWLDETDGARGLSAGPETKDTLRKEWQSELTGIRATSAGLRERIKVVKEPISPEELAAVQAQYPEPLIAPPVNTDAMAILAEQVRKSLMWRGAMEQPAPVPVLRVSASAVPVRRTVGALLQSAGAARRQGAGQR